MRTRRSLTALVLFALALPLGVVGTAVTPTPAAAASTTVDNGCLWNYDGANRNLAVTIDGDAQPDQVVPGEAVTLAGAQLSAPLQSWLPALGYGIGLFDAGYNEVPATVWVAIEATNTVEQVQVVSLDVVASTTVTPRDPNVPGSVTTATPLEVSGAVLPTTTWTSTGGTIQFKQAGPGSLVGSGAANGAAGGSLFIAATVKTLVATFDCQPGTVDVVNEPYPLIPATSWAAFDAVASPIPLDLSCGERTLQSIWQGSADPDPVVVGTPTTLRDGSVGLVVPGELFADAYRAGHLDVGEQSIPVQVTGSVTGSNPAGTVVPQTVSGTIVTTVTDGDTPGTADATATDGTVSLDLDDSSWTPTAVGTLAFSSGSALDVRLGASAGWLDLSCQVDGEPFAQVQVIEQPAPPTTPTTEPPASTTTTTTTAPPSGGEPDLTPKTGSASYPLACSYTYDLPGSGPGDVSYTLNATGTVPTRVVAGDKVTLSGQSWSVTIPWELRGPLQTGFNIGALTDGQTLRGTASTTVFASNTVEGTLSQSGIPATLGPVVKGQPSTLRFDPPDQTVTAVGGGPTGFEVRAAKFDVAIEAASFGSVLVKFDCLATAAAGTTFVSTDVVGVSDLVGATDPGGHAGAGRSGTGRLPATGANETSLLTGLAAALVLGGAALLIVPALATLRRRR